MVLIAAVDDNLGMLFNKRRQSMDRVVLKRILDGCRGRRLLMNRYSYKMFSDMPGIRDMLPSQDVVSNDSFMDLAGTGDCCFIEDISAERYRKTIESVILFRWNRKYPADFYFDLDVDDGTWRKYSSQDFVGNSHERITEEVFFR